MIKSFTFLRKFLATILLLIGTALFVYNIFDFSFFGRIAPYHYYYKSDTIWRITLGAVLIVLGILGTKSKDK